MFAILILPKKDLKMLEAEQINILYETHSVYLNESDKYVYAWSHSQDYPNSLLKEDFDFRKVISTFRMAP